MEYLRAQTALRQRGVDRKLGVIFGYVVAEEGAFKTGRGRFDESGLTEIVRHGRSQPEGVKVNWTHGDFFSESLGDYLGRSHNFRLDTSPERSRVLADLHFDGVAYKSPTRGDMATYLMDLAESDPKAVGSSLVVKAKFVYEYGQDGNLKMDGDGNPIPPLWIPEEILRSDVVADGDATTAFLSVDAPEEEIRAKLHDYVDRLVDCRFAKNRPACEALKRIDKVYSRR